MAETSCDRLDDYLSHSLPESEQIAFENHLTSCPMCRRGVEESRKLSRLLRVAIESEAIPEGLLLRLRGEHLRQSRKRLWVRVGAMAAALLLCGLAAYLAFPKPPAPDSMPESHVIVENPPEKAPKPVVEEVVAAAPEIHVTVKHAGPAIVQAMPSENKTITIYWIHRGIEVAQNTPEPSTKDLKE